MGEPMIELEAVRKAYGAGASPAVDGVSLRLERGEFVALVGGSGSGKTTTLKIINRLIIPDSGWVRIAGEAAEATPPHILRRRIGYVFQEAGLFPHLTVSENIGLTPGLLKWSKSDIAARVKELLALVGLPPAYAVRRPAALSGGERQRVGVARALAARPAVMLMDEPFGALDPLVRDRLGADYRKLHDQLGLTTLMVTHDIAEAVLLADRIAVMEAGRIAAEGTPAQLSAHPDDKICTLIDVPRRQAERLRQRLEPPGG